MANQLIFNGIAILSVPADAEADFIPAVRIMDAAFSCLFFKAPVNVPIRDCIIDTVLVGDRKFADG